MRYKTWNRVENIIASTVFGIIPVVYFILFGGGGGGGGYRAMFVIVPYDLILIQRTIRLCSYSLVLCI